MEKLNEAEVERELAETPGWERDGGSIVRTAKF
jgi:hypothetical protein